MSENITERVLFERCHDKLTDRAVELGWNSLESDAQYIALINEEIELARIANDVAMCMLCCEDLSNIAYCPEGTKYRNIEKEMLCKAAELGDMEASQRLVDFVFNDGDYNEAARCAVEHLKRGGEIDDFEWAEREPMHDYSIEDNETLPWLQEVMKVRPTASCRYVLARCYWDIEEVIFPKLWSLDEITLGESDDKRDMALPLYEQAANDGYFWAQYYYGLYLLLVGGVGKERGVVFLEKALKTILEELESGENVRETDETRKCQRETIEKALFKYTGRTSMRVSGLETSALHGDLLSCVELTIAYLKGKECPRDQDKALDYASRLLFEDREFDQLLIRMNELLPADRQWLEGKLAEEASRIEAMNG